MPRFRALVLLGLFLVHPAAGHSLAAQATLVTAITPGTKVRVRFDCSRTAPTESCHTATGTVTTLLADTLTFNTGSAERFVTPATLRELGVHDGRGRRTFLGLVVGVAGGAIAGYAIMAIANGGNCVDDYEGNLCLYGAGAGAAGGALLGAGIGSLIRYDRWRPVPSPWSAARTDRPTLGLLLTPPLRSRPGMLGITIGF
jgi:hypothetical protein